LATVFTIGHSTRTLEELIEALKAHGVGVLFDIRAFPASRRMPWFARESLEQELPKAGIQYIWRKELGGRRSKQMDDSPNTGLRNPSFRNYADYMLTPAFAEATAEVVKTATAKRAAIMCAEKMFFQCHRMLVSDYLSLHGQEVLHIVDAGPTRPHRITPEAKLVDGRVLYPGLF
jgi:uncharacterized protein (DUF488 family)